MRRASPRAGPARAGTSAVRGIRVVGGIRSERIRPGRLAFAHDVIVLSQERVDVEWLIELVLVPEDESYAANAIRVNDRVLLASGFRGTEERLRRLGYEVQTLAMSEFRKMDGGLSCLSLRW